MIPDDLAQWLAALPPARQHQLAGKPGKLLAAAESAGIRVSESEAAEAAAQIKPGQTFERAFG